MPGGMHPTQFRQFSRRLSDKILAAFDHACETYDLPVAHDLLVTLETLFERQAMHPGQDRRKNLECLVEAHHRLFACRIEAEGKSGDTAVTGSTPTPLPAIKANHSS